MWCTSIAHITCITTIHGPFLKIGALKMIQKHLPPATGCIHQLMHGNIIFLHFHFVLQIMTTFVIKVYWKQLMGFGTIKKKTTYASPQTMEPVESFILQGETKSHARLNWESAVDIKWHSSATNRPMGFSIQWRIGVFVLGSVPSTCYGHMCKTRGPSALLGSGSPECNVVQGTPRFSHSSFWLSIIEINMVQTTTVHFCNVA